MLYAVKDKKSEKRVYEHLLVEIRDAIVKRGGMTEFKLDFDLPTITINTVLTDEARTNIAIELLKVVIKTSHQSLTLLEFNGFPNEESMNFLKQTAKCENLASLAFSLSYKNLEMFKLIINDIVPIVQRLGPKLKSLTLLNQHTLISNYFFASCLPYLP